MARLNIIKLTGLVLLPTMKWQALHSRWHKIIPTRCVHIPLFRFQGASATHQGYPQRSKNNTLR